MKHKVQKPRITVLGVGNILYSDEGIGVRVIEYLRENFQFPDNVDVVDGGVLGMNLMGIITATDHLIIVDAVQNRNEPGTLYRMADEQIPRRILAKNSLHQVDMVEVLTLCRMVDKEPTVVVVGVEPADIRTLGIELTPVVHSRKKDLAGMVLDELKRLGIDCPGKQVV
ncbi:MAG: HyaD/HybD family hydrogenase maturation endopeptidase [Desulfobacteraceae bacterium]|nr:HyaD/HybD family hydrogenase maturation endopeptidase [Desulfobacteraceae bacterium]